MYIIYVRIQNYTWMLVGRFVGMRRRLEAIKRGAALFFNLETSNSYKSSNWGLIGSLSI